MLGTFKPRFPRVEHDQTPDRSESGTEPSHARLFPTELDMAPSRAHEDDVRRSRTEDLGGGGAGLAPTTFGL